jgi:hypothetical protein
MWKVTLNAESKRIIAGYERFVEDFFEWTLKYDIGVSQKRVYDDIKQKRTSFERVAAKSTKLKKKVFDFITYRKKMEVFYSYIEYSNNYTKYINDNLSVLPNSYSNPVVKGIFEGFYTDMSSLDCFAREYLGGTKNSLHQYRVEFGQTVRVCPYCDTNKIEDPDESDIDHFFPKGEYPLLSTFLNNLVVACTRCNQRVKRDRFSLPLLHPFINDIDSSFRFTYYLNKKPKDVEVDFKIVGDINATTNFINIFKLKKKYNKYEKDYILSFRDNLRDDVKDEYLTHYPMQENILILKKIYLKWLKKAFQRNRRILKKEKCSKAINDLYLQMFLNRDNEILSLAHSLKFTSVR